MTQNWLDKVILDKETPIPLYFQVKKMIKERIEKGLLTEGDTIPSEAEFCEQLGISRATVRQAITELVAEGYLYRKRAKGTYVAAPKISAFFFSRLESFNTEMTEKGMKPSTKVLSIRKIEPVGDICSHLGISGQAPLIYLERLRYADGQPIVYVETYLPYEGMEKLLEQDFEKRSLYELMEKLYGQRVTRATRKIEAVMATAREAALLQMPDKGPVCLVRTTAYTGSGSAIEYSNARYRGDRNEFMVELIR